MAFSPDDDRLSALPPEIKHNICEFLCDHCIFGWVDPDPYHSEAIGSESLRNLCLTSKAMREVAQPILYHFLFMSLDDNLGDSLARIMPFLETAWDKPYLARQIKSLSLRGLGDNGNVRHPDRPSSEITLKFLPRCYEFSVSRLLEKATRLEELELNCNNRWAPNFTADFSCLRELSIHHQHWQSGKLNSRIISAFLHDKPKLSMLTLSNYKYVSDSISEAVINIRELHMLHDVCEPAILPSIKKLVKAMPQLESFGLFNDAGYPSRIFLVDIIDALIIRSPTLKSLNIDGCQLEDKSFTFKPFSKLEKLVLFGFLEGDYQETFLLSYPDTLKQLVFCSRFINNPPAFLFDEVGEPLEINDITGTCFIVH